MRSSRIAGGCTRGRPRETRRPGRAGERRRRQRRAAPRSAMCTHRRVGPQRQQRRRPSRPAPSAARQPRLSQRGAAARGDALQRRPVADGWPESRTASSQQQSRGALEPDDQRPAAGRCPATSTSARCRNSGTERWPSTGCAGPRRLAEGERLQAQEQRAERDEQAERRRQRQPRLAGEGRGHHQELADEDAERRQAGDGDDADHQAPAERRDG